MSVAVSQERDQVSMCAFEICIFAYFCLSQVASKLKETQDEVERERQLREELNLRLQQLQSKVSGPHSISLLPFYFIYSHSNNFQLVGNVEEVEVTKDSPRFQQEREEAERAFLERKLRAKKRREANQQRLQQVLTEKQVYLYL